MTRSCAVLLVFATLSLSPVTPTREDSFDFSSPSDVLRTTADGRIRGARNRTDRDFVLGGLFPIHAATEGGGACGAVRLERGLERMEAMLFAIDMINANDSLLANITLGYDIRDTCSSENIGLDETVDLVITSSQLDIVSCQSGITSGANGTSSNGGIMDAPTSGIVGAASSRVSVPIASLVRLFTTPQISYASSSAILSNRDRYEYFYRTIPPDNLQARAMIDVMLHFGWSYVSTVYSLNPYGEPGINEFQFLAGQRNICIDVDVGISDDFTELQFAELAERLISSRANVVILFTSQDNAMQLLSQIHNSGTTRRFIWIASDAWARSINVVHMFNTTVAGLLGFAPLTEHLGTFENYFSQLSVDSNVRNPWFKEFYVAIANCSINDTSVDGRDVCNRTDSITDIPRYEQGNFIPLVVDAVYTYAQALQDFLDDNCAQPTQWFQNNRTCLNQSRPLTGAALLEYIKRVDFRSVTGNRVLFDDEGNVEGRYEILNYQASDAGGRREYSFRTVAVWDSSISDSSVSTNDTRQRALILKPGAEFQFGVAATDGAIIFEQTDSQCTMCDSGQHRRVVVPSACCGFCEPCLGQAYSDDPRATECAQCEGETWGNAPFNGSDGCVPIRESFLQFHHPYSVIIMVIATVGLGGVVFAAAVFLVFWKTPVVKSSGREQMVLLLVGIAMSFVSAFFYVSPPVVGVCGIQRWLLWSGFAAMFGALLVKIVRVARIFLRKNNIARPRYTEPVYQVFFTFLIVLVQWVILAISFGVQPPEVRREIRRDPNLPLQFPEVVVTCVVDHIALLALSAGYETVLIIACTVLGALSFAYPENFNEAKYVAFCSLSILVIWVAFIITYIATRSTQEFQNIAISLAMVMTGYAVLLCLFGPKLFIVLFKPTKNVSKLGQHVMTGGDTNTGIPLGTLENAMYRLSMGVTLTATPSATPTMERKYQNSLASPPETTLRNHGNHGSEQGLPLSVPSAGPLTEATPSPSHPGGSNSPPNKYSCNGNGRGPAQLEGNGRGREPMEGTCM